MSDGSVIAANTAGLPMTVLLGWVVLALGAAPEFLS
jgi:hypothetical protein